MKIHVRKGTGNGCDSIPACAFNQRRYKHLPSNFVVPPKEFRAAPASDRCAHCENQYLIIRNRQRKEKGLPPVKNAFEGLNHTRLT